MEAEHRVIVPAVEALTTTALHYRSAPDDAARLQLVARSLSQRDWTAWNKKANVKGKPLRELGLEGHWLIDDIDPVGYQVVTGQVPPVPRFILLHGFARAYRRRTDAWRGPQVPADSAGATA